MAGITTQEKKERLVQARDYHTRIIATINDILRGVSEAEACRRHNINVSCFRNQVKPKVNADYDYSKTKIPVRKQVP